MNCAQHVTGVSIVHSENVKKNLPVNHFYPLPPLRSELLLATLLGTVPLAQALGARAGRASARSLMNQPESRVD